MVNDFVLRSVAAGDLTDLQRISVDARRRYMTVPSLAHIADSPALAMERFQPCRIVVAASRADGMAIGFVMTRPLDQLLYLDTISVATGESGRGIGAALLGATLSHARDIPVPAIALTTFRTPVWNGPWFRRGGFEAMPQEAVGPELAGVLARQARTLDPQTRETLWLRL